MYDMDSEIGFSLKSLKKSLGKLKGGKKKKVKKPSLITSDAQGGISQRVPIGLPVVQFVFGGATVLRTTVNPQKPFMARRLIIDEARFSAAPPLPASIVTLTSFRIGTDEMLAGMGAIPIAAFTADATDMVLMTRAARPGLEIGLTFELATPLLVAGDIITVSSVLIGDAVAQ